MANAERARQDERTESQSKEIERNQPSPQSRGKRFGEEGPSLMQRMSDDVDRLFSRFFDWPMATRRSAFGETTRWPKIEAFRRGDKFVIRADVPGLNKDDVRVEVVDDELCISGERRSETERTEGDYYARELSYGSFRRTIALPPGAHADAASATFDKGVLEIEIDVPEQRSRGRRIEVREHPSH